MYMHRGHFRNLLGLLDSSYLHQLWKVGLGIMGKTEDTRLDVSSNMAVGSYCLCYPKCSFPPVFGSIKQILRDLQLKCLGRVKWNCLFYGSGGSQSFRKDSDIKLCYLYVTVCYIQVERWSIRVVVGCRVGQLTVTQEAMFSLGLEKLRSLESRDYGGKSLAKGKS